MNPDDRYSSDKGPGSNYIFDRRRGERKLFCGGQGGAGQKLSPDGAAFRRSYRAERCGVLTGVSVLAMDATVAPVSIAVELETLVTSALRYCSAVRR